MESLRHSLAKHLVWFLLVDHVVRAWRSCGWHSWHGARVVPHSSVLVRQILLRLPFQKTTHVVRLNLLEATVRVSDMYYFLVNVTHLRVEALAATLEPRLEGPHWTDCRKALGVILVRLWRRLHNLLVPCLLLIVFKIQRLDVVAVLVVVITVQRAFSTFVVGNRGRRAAILRFHQELHHGTCVLGVAVG